MPDLKVIKEKQLSEAVCVLYDQENDSPSYCQTFFNYDTNKVNCMCDRAGEIKVILDRKLARLSIAIQFFVKDVGICNIFLIY